MNKEVICSGINVCSAGPCEHHKKHVHRQEACSGFCSNQREKGNFHCKDYTIVMRREKLKRLNNVR